MPDGTPRLLLDEELQVTREVPEWWATTAETASKKETESGRSYVFSMAWGFLWHPFRFPADKTQVTDRDWTRETAKVSVRFNQNSVVKRRIPARA